jgi:3-oxoisoapionate decarboxylase
MRWQDLALLEYAAGLKLDAVYLQDSIDPGNDDPAHWKELKEAAARLDLELEGGDAGALPRTADGMPATLARLRQGIRHAVGVGSKLVRFRVAGDRASMPPGPVESVMETMIRVLRTVRTEAMDAGVKFAIENHKDLFCWQTRQVIDGAGKEFVGSYLDTGNPVYVMEDPLVTVETLGPVAVMLHLRDSVVYESRDGIAVQWVPLGEGVIDFNRIIARAREVCPPITVYNKPITGRPPDHLAIYDADFMKKWRDMRAPDLARFIALAKQGHPFENAMVIEDVPGKMPPPILAAVQYQQRDHMERGVEYARKVLDLGVKWRA